MRTHLLTVGASALFGSLLLLNEPVSRAPPHRDVSIDGLTAKASHRSRGTRLLSLQGEIEATDASAGVLTVRLAETSEEVFGAPWQIAPHRVGDLVSLTLRHYGEQRWLWPPTTGSFVTFDTQGTLTGPVEEIDDHRARVRLGGKMVHGHPEQLRALSLGERTTLHFGRVGQRWWMLDIPGTQDDPEDNEERFGSAMRPLWGSRAAQTLTHDHVQHR